MSYTLLIKEGMKVSAGEVNCFGGKAAQQALARLDDFPVPDGIAISPSVYPETTWFEKRKNEPPEKINNEVNKLLSQYGIPIFELLNSLETNSFAIRSSANIEDSYTASFAGSFFTKLSARYKMVPFGIYEVWKSALDNRVSEYAKNRGVFDEIKMGVLIQPMINSKYSGVAFSYPIGYPENPRIFISLIRGIGESLVSGKKSSQNFWLERLTYRLLKYENAQDMNGIYDGLSEIGRAIEKLELLRGCPQDIEFCFNKKFEFVLLQNRPITKSK